MQAPKCKLCGLQHWAQVCPKPTNVGGRVLAIAAQPVKLGTKGKAIKAKAKAKKAKRKAPK